MHSTPLPKPTQYRLAACLLLLTALLLAGAGVFPASAQKSDSAEVLHDGDVVQLDGHTGTVQLLEQNNRKA